jgi:hypothetical protein
MKILLTSLLLSLAFVSGFAQELPQEIAVRAFADILKSTTASMAAPRLTWPVTWPTLQGQESTIEIVDGWGHGHNLNLYQLSWKKDTLAVRRLEWSGGWREAKKRSAWDDDLDLARFSSATMPLVQAQPWLEAALGVEVAEITYPPNDDEDILSRHFSTSSNGVLGWYHIQDTKTQCDLIWNAYYRSDTVKDQIRPALLHVSIGPLLDALYWNVHQPDSEDAALLNRVWRRYQERKPGDLIDNWWWVEERMMSLAGTCPTPQLHDSFLACLTLKVEKLQDNPSGYRNRFKAATALARATGVDFRFDAKGEPRNIADVSADYQGLRKKP